jgi:hypothetical protein
VGPLVGIQDGAPWILSQTGPWWAKTTATAVYFESADCSGQPWLDAPDAGLIPPHAQVGTALYFATGPAVFTTAASKRNASGCFAHSDAQTNGKFRGPGVLSNFVLPFSIH